MSSRLGTCRSTAAISSIWHNWNQGFRSKTERTSVRTATPPSPLADVSAALPESRSMASTSPTRYLVRRTMNIPASGIQEFQLSQSSMDLSTELTTSGAVNVTTRSGTNEIHGEAFGFFRDSSLAAALPAPPGLLEPFQRSQYGGRLGGPIVKNKFFYFLDAERTLQHEQAPVLVAAPFEQYSGSFSSPFHENNLMAKADYQLDPVTACVLSIWLLPKLVRGKRRIGFLCIYDGKNITRTDVAGFDFNTGSLHPQHPIRIFEN